MQRAENVARNGKVPKSVERRGSGQGYFRKGGKPGQFKVFLAPVAASVSNPGSTFAPEFSCFPPKNLISLFVPFEGSFEAFQVKSMKIAKERP